MRRILLLVTAVAVTALPMLASEIASTQPTSNMNVAAIASDQASPSSDQAAKPEVVPQTAAGENGGFLFTSLFGKGFQKKTGVRVENLAWGWCATNNRVDSVHKSWGASDWPVAGGGQDAGCSLGAVSLVTHRDLVSNIMPKVGPVPGPTPKNFSWGFMNDFGYGRAGQPLAMLGWDQHWGLNHPGDLDAVWARQTRQNFWFNLQTYGQLYIPVLQGVEITFGKYAPGLIWEAPMGKPTQNFFVTKTYEFISQPSSVFGGLISANIMRSEKLGYLLGEFGLNNGQVTFTDMSGKKSMHARLSYRTPKQGTAVNANFLFGPGNALPGSNTRPVCSTVPKSAEPTAGCSPYNYGLYFNVVSPRSQERLASELLVTHKWTPKWETLVSLNYGRQWGDGQADTIRYLNPNHPVGRFTGAFWGGVNGLVTYKINQKWSAGFRAEHFRNPDGFGLYPVCAFLGAATAANSATCRTDLNDFTVGVHYDVSKWMMLAPELRYDFQSSAANGVRVFGQFNTDPNMPAATNQTTAVLGVYLFF
jgi:hypothetical protein